MAKKYKYTRIFSNIIISDPIGTYRQNMERTRIPDFREKFHSTNVTSLLYNFFEYNFIVWTYSFCKLPTPSDRLN